MVYIICLSVIHLDIKELEAQHTQRMSGCNCHHSQSLRLCHLMSLLKNEAVRINRQELLGIIVGLTIQQS